MHLRSLFIIYLCLVFSTAYAQVELKVSELTHGACWANKSQDARWKISSFADGKSYSFSQDELLLNFEEKIESKLKELGIYHFPASKYHVTFQCNEDRSDVIISITNNSGKNLCATGVIVNNDLKIKKFYSNPYAEVGNCTRYYPLRLLITTKSPDLFLETFEKYYKTEIDQVEVLGGFIIIDLKEHLRFVEHEFAAKIEENADLFILYEMLNFSSENYFPGDFVQLYTGTIPGF